MKKSVLTACAFVLAATCLQHTAFGATVAAGSCIQRAIALKASQDVTLVNEYDPEWKQNTDMGVAYYAVKLTRGSACTIWITGGKSAELMFSVDSADMYVDTDVFVMGGFDYESRDNGATQIAYLYSDSWDEEDPYTTTFYVAISGDIGDTCKLYYASYIYSFTVLGEEGNPERLTFTESLQSTTARSLIDGDYFFSATLEGGRKYQVYTINGTSAAPMEISINGGEYSEEPDPAHSNDVNNASGFIYPLETADFSFNVFCRESPETTQKFKLKYRAIPARSPKNHPYVQMTAAGGYQVEVTPGRVVSDLNYYDNVVDEGLGRIRLLEGERWIFQTSGAVTNIAIRLYDSEGNILKETTMPYAAGGYDIRSSLQAPATGNYYFGVYIPDLQYWEEDYLHSPVTVNAYRADDFDPPPGDEFEPVDDTADGATPIVAYAGEIGLDPTEITAADGLHALNQKDWYDWFAFPCRQGVSYALKASFVDEAEAIQHLTLAAAVYREVDGALKKYKDVRGNITPNEADLGTTPFSFTADRNGMFYLRINVAEGCGLDYPAYRLHAMAYSDQGLGLLQVNTKGYDSTWFFKNEDGAYPNGATLAVPTGTLSRVKFTPHTAEGFATPALISTNVVVGVGAGAEVTLVTGIYNDTYDPGDDTRKKGTVIYPRNYEKEAKRTLWAEDTADWFKFTAKAGCYYNIALVDTTGETLEGQVGDAMFKLIGPDLVATDTELVSVSKRLFAPGENYIGVTHANEPGNDTSYSLVFTMANVGEVKLATTSRVVSESVDYVEFTVQRTASDGRVRVHYATQSGELYGEKYPAKPGEDYYAQEGVVEWEDGDMSDKIVRIRLIPDLTPTYEGAFKKFWLKFWPMEEDCFLADEYPATIAGANEAYVKIKEGDAMTPGSVVVKMDGAPYVLAGEDFTCKIARVGGSDGTVAVDVRAINGTALAGTDYEPSRSTFIWEDGDDKPKEFVVHTADATTFDRERKFSIKMTANTDGDYETPTIPVAKTAVWIVNENVTMPLNDFMVKSLEDDGVTVAATGTWYMDRASQLRSAPVAEDAKAQVKFTVDGPGLFFARPQLVGLGTLTCTLAGETQECNGDRLALVVPAGRQTVTIRAKESDGTSYVLFDKEDDWAYKWLPFAGVEAETPGRKFVVDADVTTNLTWSVPYGFDTENIWYRVRIGSRAGKSEKIDNVLAITQETACAIPESYVLEDGKKYWWMLDYAWSSEEKPDPDSLEWIEGPSIWPFQTAVAGAAETKVAPLKDPFGTEMKDGETITLVQGLFAQIKLTADGSDADSLALVRGELPPGMALKASVGKLKGTPTVPGDYEVLLQVTSGGKPATTKLVNIRVADLGLAAGSFTGVLKEDGLQLTNNYPRVGYLQFTAGSDGTISAKAKIADKVEKFSASSFGEVTESRLAKGMCDDGPGVPVPTRLSVTLTNTRTVNNILYTNTLEVVVGTDGEFEGSAKLVWNAPDEKGVQKDIRYVCDLYRKAVGLEDDRFPPLESFAGYYTVALVPELTSAFDGRPSGYGFLTVTVSENGSVQFAGRLADGTEASGSAKARRLYEYDDAVEDTVERCIIPLCFMANSNSLGGELRLHLVGDGETAVVDSRSTFLWNKDGPASTYDGEGFSIVVQPTGGWYDTIPNLQRYYLDYAFSIETEPLTSLPKDMLPAGYVFTPSTLPSGVAVDVLGNSLSVQAAMPRVKEDGSETRYDLAASVNPWATTLNFTRATGIVSGKFKIWGDDGTTQKKSGYYRQYGVLLMNRDAKSLLDDNVWTAGFGLVGDSSWLSIPFCIRAYETHIETVDPEIPLED